MRVSLGDMKIVEFCLAGWVGMGQTAAMAMPEAAGELAPTLTGMPSLWGEFFKILVILGCLLGGLLILRYSLRKPFWLKKNGPPAQMIQILATHYLEPKKSLIVVEVGVQQFLLANTADKLTLLTTLESPSRREETFGSKLDEAVNHQQEANGIALSRINHDNP